MNLRSPTAACRTQPWSRLLPSYGLLPLLDWRAIASPTPPDETFFLTPDDPGDPRVVATFAGAPKGCPYPALPLTAASTMKMFGARRELDRAVADAAADAYQRFRREGRQPPPALVGALHQAVRRMPAFC